jgi:hypothetical protein
VKNRNVLLEETFLEAFDPIVAFIELLFRIHVVDALEAASASVIGKAELRLIANSNEPAITGN